MTRDVFSLPANRREVLFTLVEADEETPLTYDEIERELPFRCDVSRSTLETILKELARLGYVEKGRRSSDKRGPGPATFKPSVVGIESLVDLVEYRARQIRKAKRRIGVERRILPDGWSTVGTQEDLGGSRYAEESPFCPECGSVWAGEGPCEDCRESAAEEAVADGGERP